MKTVSLYLYQTKQVVTETSGSSCAAVHLPSFQTQKLVIRAHQKGCYKYSATTHEEQHGGLKSGK